MNNDLRERVAMAVKGMDTSTVEGARSVAYAAIAEMGRVKEATLKAQIHRLTAAGENLTAWVDDRGMAAVHKWDKARDEAFRALAEGQDND